MATQVDVTTLDFTPEMATQCRRAGRNEPCPHGSGRKVKQCPCPVLHPAAQGGVPWEIEKTVGEDMAVFMLAQRFADVLPGAWADFSDGDSWPGSLQALFTSKDQLTVARFVDWFLRAFPLPRYHDQTPAQLFATERADRIGPAGRRASAAYARSFPTLLRVEDYAKGETLRVRDLLAERDYDVLLTPDIEMPEEMATGWTLWTFFYTLDGVGRVSPAGVAVPPAGEFTMLSAVREIVGDAPGLAETRAAFPALVRKAVDVTKDIQQADTPQWTHAVYTAADPDVAIEMLRADGDFAPYDGKEVLPRAATALAWALPEGEAGERFVAVAAGRVVLAASSGELLGASRGALEAKLGERIVFVTESDEPIVVLLRRSWKPKAADSPATNEGAQVAEAETGDAAEPTTTTPATNETEPTS